MSFYKRPTSLTPDTALLDAIPDTLIVSSHQGDILWCNQQITDLLGYQVQDLVNQKVEVLLPQALGAKHRKQREEYAKAPSHRPMGNAVELFAKAKGGDLVPVDIELAPLTWHGEACIAAILRCRVTKLAQEAEQQKLLRENEGRLRRSQAIAKIGTWDWSLASNEISWSEEIFNILGLPLDYPLNGIETVYGLVDESHQEFFQQEFLKKIIEDGSFSFEHRVYREDGSVCYLRQNGEVYFNEDGRPARLLGASQDVTEDIKRRHQLQLSETIFKNANDGILATDMAFNIISVNPVMEKLCGQSEAQLLGESVVGLLPYHIRDEFNATLAMLLGESGSWRGESELLSANSPNIPVMASVALVNKQSGREGGYIFTVADISKLKLNEAQLDFLAHYDQLTRLPNRTHLLRELTRRISDEQRSNKSLYLFYIDLDGFKQVNDSQGHSAGDELLFEVAEQLRKGVPEGALIARLGGDEFAIVCDLPSVNAADALAELLIRRLQLRKEFTDLSVNISASVGISCSPQDGSDPLELIKKADQAMYEAKANGKNGFEHYSEQVGSLLQRKLQLTSDLADALRQENLFLMVQAKLDTNAPARYQVEALARWHHPSFGYIAPDEFIAVAEESGLIVELGRQALNLAVEFIAEWRVAHSRPISVAVNLSAKQLHDRHLIEDVQRILAKHDVAADCLEFEVTETVVMEDVESSLRIFRVLKEMGVKLAIDDFGTGYSSLSYLKKLPIDVLKIDRSFISALPASHEDLAIVQAINSMAKSLNIEVVAEGVETEEQSKVLRELGCDHLQGYLYAKPRLLNDYIQQPWGDNWPVD